MEQYKTNNKILNSILEPVVLHLQKLNYNVHTDALDVLPITMCKIKKTLANDFIPEWNNFMTELNKIKCSGKPTPQAWHNFLMWLHEFLLNIDTKKILRIIDSVYDCLYKITNLKHITVDQYILSWFKDFCIKLCRCLSLIYERTRETVLENIKNNLLLYIVQLTTCAKLLFRLFADEISNIILISETRGFLTKRFVYIFEGINKMLTENISPEQNLGFIQWMDNSLDLIAELDPNKRDPQNTKNIKTSIEEVLCHAMSIAQICSEDDCKKIKASVQTFTFLGEYARGRDMNLLLNVDKCKVLVFEKSESVMYVLQEFKQLETEFNKSVVNPSCANLSIDIVSDKLCILERRVNNAVLNISLKVFSEPFESLKKLHKFCEDSETSILNRLETDLDELILSLDSHVECMIQVGLFAIACSTNSNIVAKIRSCLASLESLECELIPALCSLYMEPSKNACLYANLFIKHWYEEVKQLRNNVCFIIDPVAFGQVVHEDFKTNLENMQQFMMDPNKVLEINMIIPLCKNVKVLILVVDASVKEMKILKESNIYKHVKNLKDVHREVLAAAELLSKQDRKISERVLKRVFILSSMIERIIKSFSEENKNSSEISQYDTLVQSINKIDINVTKIINNVSLKSLQKRGLEILKDRSILYKTPNKTYAKLSAATPNNQTFTKKTENRKLGISFIRKNILPSCDSGQDETLDLQITEILEELTNLADTLKNP